MKVAVTQGYAWFSFARADVLMHNLAVARTTCLQDPTCDDIFVLVLQIVAAHAEYRRSPVCACICAGPPFRSYSS